MKFTLSDCMSRINQALNYPAISYEDVSHFFDQAIAELNTSLRIALPLVSEMRAEHIFKISDSPYTVVLPSSAIEGQIVTVTSKPESPSTADNDKFNNNNVVYYIDSDSRLNNTLYVKRVDKWEATPKAFGIVAGSSVAYESVVVAYSYAVWKQIPLETVTEFSLTEYLPTDWIMLFLIPYVCFKFAVRNGDNGALFSDEFTQGFQQLQTSYGVPNTVPLDRVAHLPAYRELVVANLDDLRKEVPTRAITDEMRIPNGVRAVYGRNIFDNGGWGI